MQKESLKYQLSTVFEGMTSIRAIIKGIDNGINDRRIETILYDAAKIKKISKEVGYFKAVSEKYGFELKESCAEEIENYTVGTSHGGIIAICAERTIPCLSPDTPLPACGFFAMIQGIEDPYNFGYAMRSLYACGCDGIILGENYNDCGLMIFDREKQDVHAGGSGCGCSGSVLCSHILNRMRDGKYNNILFIATGALMSPVSSREGESVPGIAHLVNIKRGL